MRRLAVFSTLAALMAALVLAPCASAQEEGRYVNKDKAFSIKSPDNWTTKGGGELAMPVVASLSPLEGPDDTFAENVNVIIEALPTRISLDEYAKASVDMMKQMLATLELGEAGKVKIGGQKAGFQVYKMAMGPLKLKNIVYFLIRDQEAFVITCCSTEDKYDKYEKTFKTIAMSFRFEDKAGESTKESEKAND